MMPFNLNKGTNLTTFWSDLSFTRYFAKKFNIPIEYADAWSDHYISVEFKKPVNLQDEVTVRIYTTQTPDYKLPLTRDVGDVVIPPKYQNVTPSFVIKTNGYALNEFASDIEAELLKTRIKPQVIQNINNLQQILENKAFEINFTKLIEREQKIDAEVFPKQPKVVPNTAEVFNKKFYTKTRLALEKEIRDYNKSDYTHPKNPHDFYQGVSTGLQHSIKDPSVPVLEKQRCQNLDFQTRQLTKIIKKYYGL